jgi:hypothetical protein
MNNKWENEINDQELEMKKNTDIIQMNKFRLLDKKPRDLLLLAAQLGAIFEFPSCLKRIDCQIRNF